MTAGELIPVQGHSRFISFPETELRVKLPSIIAVQSRVFQLTFRPVDAMKKISYYITLVQIFQLSNRDDLYV